MAFETKKNFDFLLQLSLDLSATLGGEDRFQHLVDVVQKSLPADAVTLLRHQQGALKTLATIGLKPIVKEHVFDIEMHPRFAQICSSRQAVVFPTPCNLPDPFDGWVDGDSLNPQHVHSCMGIPLYIEDELAGVLALDAIDVGVFEKIPDRVMRALGALAGATIQIADLMMSLEGSAEKQKRISRSLVNDALERRGGMLVGNSQIMQRLKREISLFGAADFPVLITGETGTGKELVVRMLHAESHRSESPLVYVNCAALPDSMAESELFGHIAGSFTGASETRMGRFQYADSGCLFLDEVGELSPAVQAKLLRVLQSGEIQPIGADDVRHVDVRVFAATNRDLPGAVRNGKFREDLLHRLDVCHITAPPLREREGDIDLLTTHFGDRARVQLGVGRVSFAKEVISYFAGLPWPGNVRELENTITRLVLVASQRASDDREVHVEMQDIDNRTASTVVAGEGLVSITEVSSLREAVDDYQRQVIAQALAEHNGVWAKTATHLGMHRSNLHHLAKRLNLFN